MPPPTSPARTSSSTVAGRLGDSRRGQVLPGERGGPVLRSRQRSNGHVPRSIPHDARECENPGLTRHVPSRRLICANVCQSIHRRPGVLSPTVIRAEIPNLIAGESVPALSGEWLAKLRRAEGRCSVGSPTRGQKTSPPLCEPPGVPSPRGLSARWSSAGRSCESWRCCSASVGTRQPRSSSPRPGSRSSSRSEKLTPRSRWASSSPEKDDGPTGARRRRAWSTRQR